MNCPKIAPTTKKLGITAVSKECPMLKHKIRICPDTKPIATNPNTPPKEKEAISMLEKLAVCTAGIATVAFLIIGGYVGVSKFIKGITSEQPPIKEDPALIKKSVQECRKQAKEHPIKHAFESCLSARIPEGPTFRRLINEAGTAVDAGALRILQ